MEAEIIHAVGVCFDVRERTGNIIHAARRAGCCHIIPAAGEGVWDSSRWESQRPVWMKRRILSRRYWKYSGLTRSSSTSSMTAEK